MSNGARYKCKGMGVMIFIRYENWKSYLRYYPVTCLLIVANVIMFILMTFNGGSTNIQTLVDFGAIVDVSPFKEELWRYVAAIFLHNGFSHLFFNSFALLVFAPCSGASSWLVAIYNSLRGRWSSCERSNDCNQQPLSIRGRYGVGRCFWSDLRRLWGIFIHCGYAKGYDG